MEEVLREELKMLQKRMIFATKIAVLGTILTSSKISSNIEQQPHQMPSYKVELYSKLVK